MARDRVPADLKEELSPEYRKHLEKTIEQGTVVSDEYTGNFKLIHETDKAVYLQPIEETEPEAWVPRSVILAMDDTDTTSCGFIIYTVTMKRWIAKKNWRI